ncbi:hypothetical protein F4777DRAFT_583864 [Nemania sp. FL0916]|nr:hypothetical protein F4777DRAFT_583864 [Nemania sp. FL0916]
MSQHGTPSVRRIGFTQLARDDLPRNEPPKVNIVFVHGLRGHPQKTWESDRTESEEEPGTSLSKRSFFARLRTRRHGTSSSAKENSSEDNENSPTKQKVFWPQDFLLQDIPEAAIWTYGYNADVIGGLFQANNPNSISHHGTDLAVKLEREITNQMPIIFVAHSLGGIIVKDAIRRCRQPFWLRAKMIVFLGTPHRGSGHAEWGKIASNLAALALQDTNKSILRGLEVNSEVLENIQGEFLNIADSARIKVHSFREARALTGVKGVNGKIVEDFSSTVGLPQQLEMTESIDANHMQMARCRDKTDPRYQAISGVLTQFIRSDILGGHSAVELEASQRIPVNESYHYLLPPQNRKFTGRDAILSTLKDRLFVMRECQKLAVFGLGGVGKTQVALEFAYWVKETQKQYSVFWVPALSYETFEQAYADIARQLNMQSHRDEDIKESVRRYLESDRSGKWLMIVDNADDMEIVYQSTGKYEGIDRHLPRSKNGLTLFTTRSREVADAVAGTGVVDLHEMSIEEATVFLSKSLVRKELLQDKSTIEELLHELVYLPLAIAQAAAYLNRKQTPIKKYLALLKGTEQDLVTLMSQKFHDDTRYHESQNAVAMTWLVSFDQIRRDNSNAAELLSFISYIEPKAIPQSILPGLPVEAEMDAAIGTLCEYAFLVRRGDDDMFDMHRLVHVATRVWLQQNDDAVTKATASAIHHLWSIFPSEDPENRFIWREYLPHAQHALRVCQEYQDEEKFDLCSGIGCCLLEDRRFEEAIIALEETYQWRKTLAEDDSNRLASEYNLATAYRRSQRIEEALELIENVVTIQRKTLAEDHHDRLVYEHELARVYLSAGRIGESIKLLKNIVNIEKKTLAEDSHSRIASQHELARAYLEAQRVEEAIELLENIVVIRNKTLPEDDHARLSSQHVLGEAYLEAHRIREAIELFEHVVAVEKGLDMSDNDRSVSQDWLREAKSMLDI